MYLLVNGKPACVSLSPTSKSPHAWGCSCGDRETGEKWTDWIMATYPDAHVEIVEGACPAYGNYDYDKKAECPRCGDHYFYDYDYHLCPSCSRGKWTPQTIEEVSRDVEVVIGLYSRCNELAHCCEDDLLGHIIKLVANGHEDSQLFAQEATRLLETKRRKWYA